MRRTRSTSGLPLLVTKIATSPWVQSRSLSLVVLEASNSAGLHLCRGATRLLRVTNASGGRTPELRELVSRPSASQPDAPGVGAVGASFGTEAMLAAPESPLLARRLYVLQDAPSFSW